MRVRQFTLILHASKRLPKQCVDYLTGKAKQRRTVGVGPVRGAAICSDLRDWKFLLHTR